MVACRLPPWAGNAGDPEREDVGQDCLAGASLPHSRGPLGAAVHHVWLGAVLRVLDVLLSVLVHSHGVGECWQYPALRVSPPSVALGVGVARASQASRW